MCVSFINGAIIFHTCPFLLNFDTTDIVSLELRINFGKVIGSQGIKCQ